MGAGAKLRIEAAGNAEADDAAAAGPDGGGQRHGHLAAAPTANFRNAFIEREPGLEIEPDGDNDERVMCAHMPNATVLLLVRFRLRKRASAQSGKYFG